MKCLAGPIHHQSVVIDCDHSKLVYRHVFFTSTAVMNIHVAIVYSLACPVNLQIIIVVCCITNDNFTSVFK